MLSDFATSIDEPSDELDDAILEIVRDVQEVLISIQEEDEHLRRIVAQGSRDFGTHFRLLRHYDDRLRSLLEEFEAQSMVEQMTDEQWTAEETERVFRAPRMVELG